MVKPDGWNIDKTGKPYVVCHLHGCGMRLYLKGDAKTQPEYDYENNSHMVVIDTGTMGISMTEEFCSPRHAAIYLIERI